MEPIPTTADDQQMAAYVHNIIATWNEATDDQLHAGRRWYRTAHELADLMTDGRPVTGAGVLAALSVQTPWHRNVDLARNALAGETVRHMGDALRKVERIMLGEDPLTVLPNESKTWHFYRCIADPDDPDPVVIDRHAHDVAVGTAYGNAERGLSSKRRYAVLAHAYREAARQLGELPSTVQAVTWVVWRELISGTSTRGTLI